MTQSISTLQTSQIPDKNIRIFSDPSNSDQPARYTLWHGGYEKIIRAEDRPAHLVWVEVFAAAEKMQRDYKTTCSKAGFEPADQGAPVDVFVGVPIPDAYLKYQWFKLVERGLWRIAHSAAGSKFDGSAQVRALTVLSEMHGLVQPRLIKQTKAR